MATWNYRRLQHLDAQGEVDCFEIVEVYYDAAGKPKGYSAAALLSDYADFSEVLEQIQHANRTPILSVAEFRD